MSNIMKLSAVYEHLKTVYAEDKFKIESFDVTGNTAVAKITLNGEPIEKAFNFKGDVLEV